MRHLLVIILLALSLRVVFLTDHPSGFTPDEASFGYDAYSLLVTGRDQWGHLLPLTLESFGDYKMALYSYLAVPSVAIFGLSEFSTRLPNALFGTLAVVSTYFLVFRVFNDKKTALLASFLLAISPWHIPMSRGAFEANLTTFFLTTGLLFLEMGKRDRKYLTLGAFILGLNLFTYHAARIVTPLVAISFVVSNQKEYRKSYSRFAVLIAGVFLAVAGYTYLNGAGARATTAGIFSLANQVADDRYDAVLVGLPDQVARIFNNKLTHITSIFVSNYFLYFSPQFLFTHGPAEGTYGMLPGSGVLYYYEIVFILGFFWGAFTGRIRKARWLFAWLLVAPIPAALAIGPGYAANRSAVMMPAIQIVSALGATFLFERFLAEVRFRKLAVYGFCGIATVFFLFFLEDYFYQQPAKQAHSMIYGAREAVLMTRAEAGNVKNIIFSKKISEPHIYVMFYNSISPKTVQLAHEGWNYKELGFDWVDQIPEYTLGIYTFKNIDWQSDSRKESTILVGRPEEFPYNHVPDSVVYYPDGSEAYWLVYPSTPQFVYAY